MKYYYIPFGNSHTHVLYPYIFYKITFEVRKAWNEDIYVNHTGVEKSTESVFKRYYNINTNELNLIKQLLITDDRDNWTIVSEILKSKHGK